MTDEKCGCGPYYDCGDHDTDPTRAIAKLKADRDRAVAVRAAAATPCSDTGYWRLACTADADYRSWGASCAMPALAALWAERSRRETGDW